ncbi:MAG: hypothetical protein ABSD44_15990 [Terracidiphilus sp.]|jgi:hypothetical protein
MGVKLETRQNQKATGVTIAVLCRVTIIMQAAIGSNALVATVS